MRVYRRLPTHRGPTTPGEMLVEEFLKPLNMTQAEFAKKTGLGPRAINEICRGKRSVTARSAILFSDVLGMSADFWLNCQQACDLWQAIQEMGRMKDYERQLKKREKELTEQLELEGAPKKKSIRTTKSQKKAKSNQRIISKKYA